ncbi:hypothetical protein D9M71_717920 [compost metagenome]
MTVTNSNEPVLPCFSCTLRMVERRDTSASTSNGEMNSSRLPAHMRLRLSAGGRKPPRAGWPSLPRPTASTVSWKNAQCQSKGRASPGPGAGSLRVAAMRLTRLWVIRSWLVSVRPIQALRSCVVIVRVLV